MVIYFTNLKGCSVKERMDSFYTARWKRLNKHSAQSNYLNKTIFICTPLLAHYFT